MDLISSWNVEQVRAEIPKIHSIRDSSVYPYPGRIIARCKRIRLGRNDFHDHSIPSIYFVAKVSDQVKKRLYLLGLSFSVVPTGFSHDPLPGSRHNCTELSWRISTVNPLASVPLSLKEKRVCFQPTSTSKISATTITPFAFGSVKSNLSWVLGLHCTIFHSTKAGSQMVSPALEPCCHK